MWLRVQDWGRTTHILRFDGAPGSTAMQWRGMLPPSQLRSKRHSQRVGSGALLYLV